MIPTPRCRQDEATAPCRTVFWVLPHLFFPAYLLHVWPKSLPDRALSCTELGHRLSVPTGCVALGCAGIGILVGGTQRAASPPWRAGAYLPQGVPRAREEARGDALPQGGLRRPGRGAGPS